MTGAFGESPSDAGLQLGDALDRRLIYRLGREGESVSSLLRFGSYLFSRMFNEITLILDTLLRSKRLSVETCHPLLSYQPAATRVRPDLFPSQIADG